MNYRGILVILIALILVFAGCGKKKTDSMKENSVIEQNQKIEDTIQENVQDTEPVETKDSQKDVVADKTPQKSIPEMKKAAEPAFKSTPVDEGPAIYSVQLSSLTDLSRVKLQQEIMQKDGIDTDISQFVSGDTVYYRLRLKGKYTKSKAESLGKEMTDKFWSITDYWIFQE